MNKSNRKGIARTTRVSTRARAEETELARTRQGQEQKQERGVRARVIARAIAKMADARQETNVLSKKT
jgi:hypothetical protein